MLIIIVYYTIFIIMYSVLIWRMQNEPQICTKQCMLCECPCILLSLLLLLLFCVYYWFFKIIISWFVKYCYEDVIMVLFFFGYFHKQNMVNKYVTYNLFPSVFIYTIIQIESFPLKLQNIPYKVGQHHACWCPGSLHRQVISRHGIDYVN